MGILELDFHKECHYVGLLGASLSGCRVYYRTGQIEFPMYAVIWGQTTDNRTPYPVAYV